MEFVNIIVILSGVGNIYFALRDLEGKTGRERSVRSSAFAGWFVVVLLAIGNLVQ